MEAIILLFAVFFVGCGCAFVVACVFTKKMKSVWLRQLIRALIFSVAFTPVIIPAPELHGSLPMPAAVALLASDWRTRFSYGFIPLIAVAFVYWSVATLISFLIKKYPAEE